MQVEVPPWVTQWLSAAEWRRRQRERDRRMPGLTLYAYGPYGRNPPNPVQPIFRIGGFPDARDVPPRFGAGSATGSGAATNPAGGWVPLHYPLDPFLAHNLNDLSHLPISLSGTRQQRVNVEWLPPPTARASSSPSQVADNGMMSGRVALRSWVFGSAMVVLVLVLVRAIDKCLTANMLKSQRRRSQEWPTPNVLATSHHETGISTVMIPDSEGTETRPADYSDVLSVDLPPPYSECAVPATNNHPIASSSNKPPDYEDPPPAYSDTYVEFSNKNGIPSVLIYSRRRAPLVNRRSIVGPYSSEMNDEANNLELAELNTNETNGDSRTDPINVAEAATTSELDANNASCIECEPNHPDMNVSSNTGNHLEINDPENTTNPNPNVVDPNSTTINVVENASNAKDGELIV